MTFTTSISKYMNEAAVRHFLINNCSERSNIDICAIENSAGVGNPDTNYCIHGRDGWIEIKYKEDYPVRPSTPVMRNALRPSQIIWFRDRLKAGSRHIFFFIRISTDYYLLGGNCYTEFDSLTRGNFGEQSVWWGGVRNCDWDKLFRILEKGF